VPPDRAWTYTPRELDVVFRGLAAQRKFQEKLAILTGWVTAACMRQKRLPSLAKLLGEHEPSRTSEAQTMEQQVMILDAYSAALASK
jgi:hypothetical protein